MRKNQKKNCVVAIDFIATSETDSWGGRFCIAKCSEVIQLSLNPFVTN